MKRIFVQSVVLSLIVHIAFFLGNILIGYYQTMMYVPDIVNAYENVKYLQNEVEFGVINNSHLSMSSFFLLSFTTVTLIFLLLRLFLILLRSKG
jgi:quinol-cytochrome oxidoreductase complex cytochrome b subunit